VKCVSVDIGLVSGYFFIIEFVKERLSEIS
jgi:hypothetical protein